LVGHRQASTQGAHGSVRLSSSALQTHFSSVLQHKLFAESQKPSERRENREQLSASPKKLFRKNEANQRDHKPPMSMQEKNDKALDKNIRELQDLLKLPENKYCADCGAKHPRWASSNLKIFVCIRCSGTFVSSRAQLLSSGLLIRTLFLYFRYSPQSGCAHFQGQKCQSG
jgi:hypothetical protein